MLSRVADSAYWMSRYIERAESIAAMVDVHTQLMLDLPSGRARQLSRNWFPLIQCMGDEEAFRAAKASRNAEGVTEFLLFTRGGATSITGCLAAARENARTIREQITSEMWEQINRSYLWLISRSARQFYERNAYEFFQRVKKSLQLFQGICDSGMLRGEGWEFIELGKHIERADKTLRLIDPEFFLLSGDAAHPADAIPQWQAILRVCSAKQIYRRLYAATVDPVHVAELLLLNRRFPRSVVFCLERVHQSLKQISAMPAEHFSNEAEKLSGQMVSRLRYSSIEDLSEKGLHDISQSLLTQLNDLGATILRFYIEHPATR